MGGKMLGVNRIQIDKAIVHILEPGKNGLTLSNQCLQPTNAILTRISKQIQRSGNNKNKITSKFSQISPTLVSGISQRIINDPKYFIKGSQEIAKILHQIVYRNRKQSNCDLVICLYQDINTQKKYVAISKMELSSGLQNQIIDDNGDIVIDVGGLGTFTPGTFQKIAIIREFNKKNKFDVQIIDYQVDATSKFGAAKYFLIDFLDCNPELSNQHLTRLLYENMVDIENKLRKEKKYRYAKKTTGILPLICKCKRRRFKLDVLDEWMNTLRFSDKQKEIVKNEIKPALLQRTFYIHKTTMKEYCQRVKYHNSKELLIEVEGNKSNNVRLLRRRLRWIDNKIFLVPSLVKIKTDQWVRMKY